MGSGEWILFWMIWLIGMLTIWSDHLPNLRKYRIFRPLGVLWDRIEVLMSVLIKSIRQVFQRLSNLTQRKD